MPILFFWMAVSVDTSCSRRGELHLVAPAPPFFYHEQGDVVQEEVTSPQRRAWCTAQPPGKLHSSSWPAAISVATSTSSRSPAAAVTLPAVSWLVAMKSPSENDCMIAHTAAAVSEQPSWSAHRSFACSAKASGSFYRRKSRAKRHTSSMVAIISEGLWMPSGCMRKSFSALLSLAVSEAGACPQISNQMQRVVGTSQYQGTISVKLSKHSLLPGTGNPPEGTRRSDSEAENGQLDMVRIAGTRAPRRIFDSG